MAMKVEVTVADIVRSFAKGVIGERIAVRKLEAHVKQQWSLGYKAGRDSCAVYDKPVIHTDNL